MRRATSDVGADASSDCVVHLFACDILTSDVLAGPREHRVRRVRAGQGGEDGRGPAGAAAAGLHGGGQQHRVEGLGQRAPRPGQGKLIN